MLYSHGNHAGVGDVEPVTTACGSIRLPASRL
jgi:hypothetical protein